MIDVLFFYYYLLSQQNFIQYSHCVSHHCHNEDVEYNSCKYLVLIVNIIIVIMFMIHISCNTIILFIMNTNINMTL